MTKKRLAFTALALVLVFSLALAFVAGCGPKNALQTIQKKGKIVVGTSPDYPPFEYIDDTTGKYTGFDVELMEAIAAKLGVAVEWQEMEFDLLLSSLQAGEMDAVIACMTIRPDRLEQADFTDPYIISKDAILIKKGSGLVILDPATTAGMNEEQLLEPLKTAIAGLRVGVQSGTIQETFCQDLIDAGTMPETNVTRYPRADQAVADLEFGRVDCVFLDEGVADGFTQTNNVEKALTVDLEGNPGIAVKKGETEFVAKLNEIIKQLRDEGVISQLAAKYQLPGN